MPLAASLLFALHPLATESVSYISSRSTLLATFFYLSSLYVFIRIFTVAATPHRWVRQSILAAIIGCMFYLTLTSKLTAATLPFLLCVWFLFIISPARFPSLHTKLLSGGALLFYALILIALLKIVLELAPLDHGNTLFGKYGYFMMQLQIIVFYYLKMFFLPINQNMDIGFPFSEHLMNFDFIFAVVILLSILGWVLFKGNPWLKTGTIWFFLTLAPTSSFFPLNDLAVEHRLYLPMSLGLCVIVGQSLAALSSRRRLRVLLILIVVEGLLTTARNPIWIDDMTLWQDSVSKNPHSPRPSNNLGKAYYYKDEKEHALQYFRKSISQTPSFSEARFNLANTYMDLKRLKAAEKEYQTVIALDREHFKAYLGLGSIYNQMGRYDDAIEKYNQANEVWKLHRPGDYGLAKLNLGEIYGNLGNFEKAIQESSLALISSPTLHKAHFNIGNAYQKLGDLEKAERSFLNCLGINSQFEKAQFNLAHLYQAEKEWYKSSSWFERYLQTKGPDAKAYFGIAWNYQQSEQWEQARKFYEKSIAIQPDYVNATINLANLHIKFKQFDKALVLLGNALKQEPKHFKVHVQMGIIYWKIRNNKTKAKNHFNHAIENARQGRQKAQISKLIQALQKS
ncbi:MAG: tetratricopeptide repeat protein [Nitrospinota bacterium]|nr:tetratricopeptide repeat protein [Nitrospinota bacterium]